MRSTWVVFGFIVMRLYCAETEDQVDVRIVAATNKDLGAEIDAGNFREDLYHRLSVILIKVPSLNERRSDVPILANHFLEVISKEQGLPQRTFSKEALSALSEFDWTGNIRELRNVVERLIILGEKEISAEDVKTYVLPK